MQEEWLDHADIEFYMGMLNAKYSRANNVKCMDLSFLTTLDGLKDRNPTQKNKNRLLSRFFFENGQLPKFAIMPFHTCKDHWTLVVISFETHHIIVVDPLDSLEDITTPTISEYTLHLLEIFLTLVALMKGAQHDAKWNYIFKTTAPWVYYRAYHLNPQNDVSSCGYITLQTARLCCFATHVSDIMGFLIEDHETCRETIKRELGEKKLSIAKPKLQTMGIALHTYNARILTKRTLPIRLRCIIDPFVAFQLAQYPMQQTVTPNRAIEPGKSYTLVVKSESSVADMAGLIGFLKSALVGVAGLAELVKSNQLTRLEIAISSDYLCCVVSECGTLVTSKSTWIKNGAPKRDEVDVHNSLNSLFHLDFDLDGRMSVRIYPEEWTGGYETDHWGAIVIKS